MESRIELNIYDSDDEIIKTYSTRGLRWGVVEDALVIDEQLNSLTANDQVKAMKSVVMGIFPDMTEEHRKMAYVNDIVTCFKAVVGTANGINAKK